MTRDSHRIAVIGAGAFGGWIALHLLRRGAAVTLVDAWGPGNSRASSGGESRILRAIYGADPLYTRWVAQALAAWRHSESAWQLRLYHRCGALWMFQGDDDYARSALPHLQEVGLAAQELSLAEARRRFPQVDFAGVHSVFVEPEAGVLRARRACRAVREAVVAEGGEYLVGRALPPAITPVTMPVLELAAGGRVAADSYVYACGPWLASLFPDLLGPRISVSRQETYYFGTPSGDGRFGAELGVWVDFGDRIFYGCGDHEGRGVKIGDDSRQEAFDPDSVDRTPTAAGVERARRHLGERFPALAQAPLLEARVCQYSNSPDGDLIIDRHPGADNVWLVGGGSGHGFKLGPVVGAYVAGLILDQTQPQPRFALARFATGPPRAFRTQMGRPR